MRVRLMRPEQQGAQRRAQRQREEERDGGSGRDGDGELAVELAGDAADERGRHEHRHEHQRDGDERRAHLVHGDARSLQRRETLRAALDVLHHHDHRRRRAHRQQSEQGEHVEGETERLHHRARADQRHGDGDDGNEGGAPGLEEQQHDQHHQPGRLQDRDVELPDRDFDELGRIVGDAVFEPLGEALGHFGHRVLDAIGGGHRVGAGQLVDDDDDGRVAVGVALGRVAERAQLDAGDILDADDAPVGADLDDDVLELVGRPQAPLHLQGHLERVVAVDRRLTQRAARHLHVLGALGLPHLLGRPAA
jgi:hypothetical protein